MRPRLPSATAVLGGVLLALAGAAPASAHSALVSSLPAEAAQVATAPPEVVLVFDEPVSTRFSQVEVTGPDGSTWSTGEPEVSGSTVVQDLAETGPAGTYSVAYRVMSADGHPVSGTRTFELTVAGAGTPPARADEGSSEPAALPLVGVGVLLAAGAGVAVRRRARTPG